MSTTSRTSFFQADPWGPAYVWARAFIALNGFCTLVFNSEETLLHPRVDVPVPPVCTAGLDGWSAFCHADVSLVRWLGAAVLLAVLSGYRPRWFAVPHAWIAWSISHTMSLTEGGDQMASNLALFLMPIALLDDRKWVWWGQVRFGTAERPWTVWRTIGLSALGLTILQGFIVYFDAGISKLLVPEWADGTATYYWMRDPIFSPGGFRGQLVQWATDSRIGVTLVTWGTIALELALAAALIGSARYRRTMFFLGVFFHGVIALTYGLITFGFAATGLLTTYLAYDAEGGALEVVARWLPRKNASTAEPNGEQDAIVAARGETLEPGSASC